MYKGGFFFCSFALFLIPFALNMQQGTDGFFLPLPRHMVKQKGKSKKGISYCSQRGIGYSVTVLNERKDA